MGGDFTGKLCGMSKNVALQDKSSPLSSCWSTMEMQNLARLVLNLLMGGTYKFESSDFTPDFSFKLFTFNKFKSVRKEGLKIAGDLATDLVEKLMDSSHEITLSMVYHHIIFWNIYDQISFLKDVSDELFAQTLPDIKQDANKVFDGEWKVNEVWFAEMIEVPEEMREMKKELEEMKSTQQRKDKHGIEERKETLEESKDPNTKAECNKATQPVYSRNELKDLLRLIRKSVNHLGVVYPNKVMLGRYVFSQFPALLPVAYNYVLMNGKKTEVYNQYCLTTMF